MRKKLISVLISLLLLMVVFCMFCGFTTTIPSKKFYINSAAVDTFKRMTTVYSDSGGYYVMGKQYILSNITVAPYRYSSFNNIDSVIYMVRDLENVVQTRLSAERATIFNTVAGYIRSIRSRYQSNGLTSGWNNVAGDFDASIIKYTGTSSDGDGVSIRDFFASFVSESEYNVNYDSHAGAINSYFLAKNYSAVDPLDDPFSPKFGIDLIHMFACIDGIYENTGKSIFCSIGVGNNFSKDLCSWLGDLQTYAKEIAVFLNENNLNFKNYNLNDGFIDFNKYNAEKNAVFTNFSGEDFNADIDAMNIVKLFYEGTNNSLSEAILGYYTVIKPDTALKGNRFDAFISSCTMDLDGGQGYSTLKDQFMNEVCHGMNIEYTNGIYLDHDYNNNYKIKYMGEAAQNFEARKYAAKLFCDYVIMNSHRFD